jgi:hypothetical protein
MDQLPFMRFPKNKYLHIKGIIAVVDVSAVADFTAVAGVTDVAGIIGFPRHACCCMCLAVAESVIFVLFLLQLSTLLLPSFCCCWHPWSPAVFAVAGDSFLLAFLLIIMSLLLLS